MLPCLILLLFFSNVMCFTPNCVPQNQFRFYRFSVQSCSKYFHQKCRSHRSGYFRALGDASLVRIEETEIVPTCAFSDNENLKRIVGVNNNIKVLATGAFRNLPNLEGIHLAFNSIIELGKGVFQNVSVKMLDLSWNKLIFIDSRAFAKTYGLKSLNLSRNSLATISINSLPSTLIHLHLRDNLLTRIALNSNKYRNLAIVDLSNNLIEKVAILFSYPLQEIDLTNNQLQDFDYIQIRSVSMFKIGKNRFENMPKYLENLNAKEIDLYPNPWKCDQLSLLWEILVSFNIRLTPREAAKNPPAECSNTGGHIVTTRLEDPCLEDYQCPDHMVCRTKKCWDPCENAACHKTSSCETKNHRFTCSCQNNLISDPLDVHGVCNGLMTVFDINRPYVPPVTEYIPPSCYPDWEKPWWFEEIPKLSPDDPNVRYHRKRT